MVKRKINYMLVCILLILSCLLTCLNTTFQAFASSVLIDSAYSSAIEDLRNDTSFNEEDYPVNKEDYSLQVINVAESKEQELFIYVYQPCSPNTKLKATTINMSLVDSSLGSVSYDLYTLTLLNTSGVFAKYIVDDFVVSTNSVRYYNIASIHSKWYDEYFGDSSNGGSNTTEKGHKVAKCFCLETQDNGSLSNSTYSIDVVTILDKWVSHIRFYGGSPWLPMKSDSFFCAFSADRDLGELMNAKITYKYYTYYEKKQVMALPGDDVIIASVPDRTPTNTTRLMSTTSPVQLLSVGDIIDSKRTDYAPETKILDAEHENKISLGGIFRSTYTWNDIVSCDSFKETYKDNLSETAKEQLKTKDWILNFHNAEYKEWSESIMTTPVYSCTERDYVEEVTILELTYKIHERTYNVGVVDNKNNGTEEPAGVVKPDWWEELFGWVKTLIAIIGLILAIIVLYPILPVVFSILWSIIKIVIKIILWIVLLPIRCISWLIKKSKRE